jgi:hypothetical protein
LHRYQIVVESKEKQKATQPLLATKIVLAKVLSKLMMMSKKKLFEKDSLKVK